MDVSVLFLEGLTSQSRQVVEMMCNGEFKDKSSEGVLDYLDYIVENAQHWDTVSSYESSNKSQSSLSGRGMYNLRENYDLQVGVGKPLPTQSTQPNPIQPN